MDEFHIPAVPQPSSSSPPTNIARKDDSEAQQQEQQLGTESNRVASLNLMDDKDVTEVEPKTGVDLNRVDELVLRQIVNKFSSRSGLNFYRSCRGAMGFVDYAKPAWHRPDQRYHILLGRDESNYLDHLVLMDVATYTWTRLPMAMPYKVNCLGAAFLKGELYIFGGGVGLDNCKLAYKLTRNLEWERLPDMNHGRSSICPSSVVFQGCIWVMGGRTDRQSVNTVEAYDPASNSWIRKPSMNFKRGWTTAAVINGKLFVCGDWKEPSVEYYDPQLSRWMFTTPLPTPTGGLAAVVQGSRLIVMGGVADKVGIISNVWSMDVEEDNPKWTEMPGMQLPRFGHCAMLFGGKVVVPGGKSYVGQTNVAVEIFDGKTWTRGPDLPGPNDFMPSTPISEELAQKLLKEYSQ